MFVGSEIIEESKDETKVGDRVLVESFKAGELVDVSGVSKGKGFAGAYSREITR